MVSPISSSSPSFFTSASVSSSSSSKVDPPSVPDTVSSSTTYFFNQLAAQSTDPSLNSFLNAIQTAQLDFKQNLYTIEFSEPELHSKFATDAAAQMELALEKYESLLLDFTAALVNAQQTAPYTTQSNTSAQTANSALTTAQQNASTLNSQVTSYNQAASTLDAENQAGFSSTAARDAAIDQYNTQVSSYNSAAQAYDQSVNAANTQINAYNASLTQLNAQINANNASIDQLNIQRQAQGLPPLPHQPLLTPEPLLQYANPQSIPTLPHANFTSPLPQASQVPSPPSIPIMTLPTQLNFYNNFLVPDFLPFYSSALFYCQHQETAYSQSLKNVDLPRGALDQTLPNATFPKTQINPVNVNLPGGSGGGMVTTATGLNNDQLSGILSEGLVNEIFSQQVVGKIPALYQKLLPFSLAVFNRSILQGALPGMGTLGNNPLGTAQPPNAIRVAESVGALASLLGVLNANALQKPIASLVDSTVNLKDTSQTNKTNITKGLNALVSNATLKLALGSLVHETQSPGLLKTIDAATILSQSPGAAQNFAHVQSSFSDLVNTKGTGPITELLNQFLTSQLIRPGPNRLDNSTAASVASAVATSTVQQGIPATSSQLSAQVTSAVASTLGTTPPPAVIQGLTNNIALFSLAASAKSELQDQLISNVGPKATSQLTDQIVQRLFGFSVDFSEPAIVQREKEESGGLSVVTALKDNLRVINNQNDSTLSSKVADDFNQTHQSITKLESFLSNLIDPGHKLVRVLGSLMYQEDQGNVPRGKKPGLDISL